MTPAFPHEMLVANAGSGKTYQLTNRTLRLLALGVEPRSMATLTFTNKAAGEFLDAIFDRLAEAALDEAKLARLREDLSQAQLQKEDCIRLLQILSGQLGDLCMGTIDSLFGRLIRTFPLESGLPAELHLLDTAALAAAQEESLAALFESATAAPELFEGLLDLVRKQSRTKSERDVFQLLRGTVDNYYQLFLDSPPTVSWGDPSRIWPDGCEILQAPAPLKAAEELWELIQCEQPVSETIRAAWETNLELIAALEPGQSWPPELQTYVEKKLCNPSTSKQGDVYIPHGNGHKNRLHLTPAIENGIHKLLCALYREDLETRLERSRTLHQLMAQFDEIHAARFRRRGLLTFQDITRILSQQVEKVDWVAAAGYRLDSKIDHWLLDEFQDTSRQQWKVLSTFIDEVVQDPEGRRSFFYVGDTKQALYIWREGDPRLFFEVRDYYNQNQPEVIKERSLTCSHRSAPPIIDFVNQTFFGLDEVAETLEWPAQTRLDWEKAWREHQSAERLQNKSGYVQWIAVDKPPKSSPKSDSDPEEAESEEVNCRFTVALETLRHVEPWRRGISCAILLRKNKDVAAVADLLREEGIPVSVEGSSNPCTDNPLGQILLAAFRAAALPGDRLAFGLLQSSPLGETLLEEEGNSCRFRERILDSIARHGYAQTTREFLQALTGNGTAFSEDRAEAFLRAATRFDEQRSSSDDVQQFLAYIEAYKVQEPENDRVVRVMTIHQSKGLTFDMCMVLGLDDRSRTNSTDTLVRGGEPGGEWALMLPKQTACNLDPVLKSCREKLRADECYGQLCTAYVALTRARFGLYILTTEIGAKSTSKGFARWLRLKFATDREEHQAGDPDWFKNHRIAPEAETPPEQNPPPLPKPRSITPHPSPASAWESEEPDPERTATMARFASAATDLGTEVHLALARIEFLNAESRPELPPLSEEARKRLGPFLDSAQARRVFERPARPFVLWREKAFDVLLDGQWISGIFDRVVVLLSQDGNPESAVIYDFKTDRADAAEIERRHSGQMKMYQAAVSRLLGIPVEKTEAVLVPIPDV